MRRKLPSHHATTIFISYRRGDSSGHTLRLVDEYLREKFHDCNIFIDTDDNQLRSGDRWREVIEDAIKASSIFIAVIGNNWLKSLHERLYNGNEDIVRFEIAIALRSPLTRVMPILVDGAAFPKKDDLPDDIKDLYEWHARTISNKNFTYEAKRFSEELRNIMEDTGMKPEKLKVGGLTVNWIILQASKYMPSDIRCFYSDEPISLIDEFQMLVEAKKQDVEAKRKQGILNQPYNGKLYKLAQFDLGYRKGDKEITELTLQYRPTDYFTQLVTDLNVGHPKRANLINQTDITRQPVEQFSTIMGVNLNLLTKDGYIGICHRPSGVHVAGNRLHTAVAENILRPADAREYNDGHYAPDPYMTAIRGIEEEIGLKFKPEQIHFTHFGVEPTLCQYSLIGWIQTDKTYREMEEVRSSDTPKDKYECAKLEFIKLDLETIAKYMVMTWDRWFSIGQAALALSLFQQEYLRKDIDNAFKNALHNA